jgi:hypothetical protein
MCTVVGCNNLSDPRWYVHDAQGNSFMACDGHGCDETRVLCSACAERITAEAEQADREMRRGTEDDDDDDEIALEEKP